MTKWKDRTRGGFEYRIDDENAGGDFPIRGSIKTIDEYYRPTGWHSNGHYFGNGDFSDCDLVRADPEPVEQVRSLDEYCQTYCNEYYTAVGTIKRGIKAVLDLANVKYREAEQ